jgi:hypothetical protein
VVLAAGGFIANLEPWLLVPVGALVLTCITAMFFAVQAARLGERVRWYRTPDARVD